jgi:demethylmenaquinone methyltransferase/2-methoxy-6-polyprenyl-1,4-benzoquinol methylase
LKKKKQQTKKYPKIKNMAPKVHVDLVKDMFSTISGKYDILNHVMSMRRDVAWRRFSVKKLLFFKTYRFLDLATGTADMAIDAAKNHPRIKITALDFVQEMMDIGREKILRNNLSSRIKVLRGDATSLPFPDNSFDAAGISFGIRNIPDKAATLNEMARVVVPGGQILILEMTPPETRFFSSIYRIYLNYILPKLATMFSPNPAAYLYLGDSIMNFPKPGEFAHFMTDQGIIDVKAYPLTLGITHLFMGIVK